MNKIAVVYATWHGQAREVAQHVADIALLRGLTVEIEEVTAFRDALDEYTAMVIVGSVHFGRHAIALKRFVKSRRRWLSEHPTAFLSVSGAAIAMDGRKIAGAQIEAFLRATRWRPDMSAALAGAIPFTKYDPITRWAMKFAGRIAGRDVDTSRDYDYTNWFNVDAFTHSFIDSIDRFRSASEERGAGLAGAAV